MKFAVIFIEALGAGLLFPMTYYFEEAIPRPVIGISAFLGVFFVGMLIRFWWRERRHYAGWIGAAVLAVVSAACIMPYLVMDFSNPLSGLLSGSLQSCFSKYKLQYQLTSSVVLLTIFLCAIKKTVYKQNTEKTTRQAVAIAVCIALLNGLGAGVYSAHWQTVKIIGGTPLSQNFMYPPYPDWDYGWTDSLNFGWIKGSHYTEYLSKPEITGGEFRNKNDTPPPEIGDSPAVIYLMLSDSYIGERNPTNYWDYFYLPDSPRTFNVGENSISFSAATANATRYAIVDYSAELLQFLYRQDYVIARADSPDDTPLSASNLNFILVW